MANNIIAHLIKILVKLLSCSEQPCGGDLNKLIRYYGSKKGPVEIGSHDWRGYVKAAQLCINISQQHFATGMEKEVSFFQVEIFLLFLGHGKGLDQD